MMTIQHWAGVIALVLSSVSAVPPEDFGFPISEVATPLSVVYQTNGDGQVLLPGTLFGADVPAQAPTIAVNETADSLVRDYNGSYVLFMVDPDASYPENPQNRFIIHWWQENLIKSTTQANDTSLGGTLLENSTAARVDYRRPRPPTNSSAHRYIQYLFQQPAGYQIPVAYSGYNSTNSSRFPFESFLSDAGLNSPVAANYFYCSNATTVPATFVAAPGQEYPGGNGAMVTQGTNEPSATTGSPSATSGSGSASGSATASASTSAAAGNVLRIENVVVGLGIAAYAPWWILG